MIPKGSLPERELSAVTATDSVACCSTTMSNRNHVSVVIAKHLQQHAYHREYQYVHFLHVLRPGRVGDAVRHQYVAAAHWQCCCTA
jgi:hypothetical protein